MNLASRLLVILTLTAYVMSAGYPLVQVFVLKSGNFGSFGKIALPAARDISFNIFIPNTDKYRVSVTLSDGNHIDLVGLYKKYRFLNRYMKVIIIIGNSPRTTKIREGVEIVVTSKPASLIFGAKSYKAILYLSNVVADGRRLNVCKLANVTCYSVRVPEIKVSGKTILLDLPVGPTGTRSYRDLRPLHLPDGTTVRVNNWFYAVAKNVNYKQARTVLLRSKDFVHWQVIAVLPFGASSDIVLVNDTTGILIANPKMLYLFNLSAINCPSAWKRIEVKNKLLELPQYNYIAVPYAYMNFTDHRIWVAGEQLYMLSLSPKSVGIYSLGCLYSCCRKLPWVDDFTYLIVHTPIWPWGEPKPLTPLVFMSDYGMRTPNPMIFYWKSRGLYLILSNPIPEYFVSLPVIGLLHGQDYIPLPPGTWVHNYGDRLNNRHETPQLVTTQESFDKGSFWIAWWHNVGRYRKYKYSLMKVGNMSTTEFPNIQVKFLCEPHVLKFKKSEQPSILIFLNHAINYVQMHKHMFIFLSVALLAIVAFSFAVACRLCSGKS